MKRIAAAVTALLCAVLLCFPASAAGYRGGKLSIVSEPETFSAEDVTYYKGDQVLTAGDLVWVDDGYEGKALKLSGNGEFLRLWHTVVRVPAFTFSAMVNWQGGESGQRLFTIARDNTSYITVSPFMYDPAIHMQDGFANGLYMRYQFNGTGGTVFDMFNPTSEEVSYKLPQNTWHHVAMVADGETVKLYIDGVRWFEEQVLTSLYEIQPHSLDIGAGEWGDPTLNALLDNVEIYRSALNEQEILALAGQRADVYLPTRPTTTEPEPTTTMPSTVPTTTARKTLDATLWGVPMWGVYAIIGVVAAYVALTVVLNIVRRKEDGQ